MDILLVLSLNLRRGKGVARNGFREVLQRLDWMVICASGWVSSWGIDTSLQSLCEMGMHFLTVDCLIMAGHRVVLTQALVEVGHHFLCPFIVKAIFIPSFATSRREKFFF